MGRINQAVEHCLLLKGDGEDDLEVKEIHNTCDVKTNEVIVIDYKQKHVVWIACQALLPKNCNDSSSVDSNMHREVLSINKEKKYNLNNHGIIFCTDTDI